MRIPRAFRAAAIAIVSGVSLFGATGPGVAGPVVIELFTSQGCSACPPADALMGEFVDRSDVIALSLPVDYWNYLGWEDTLAQHAHTERQRGYALSRGDGQIYTPQMIIGGLYHAVGSDRAAINAAITEAAARPEVPVTVDVAGSAVHINVGDAPPGGPTWGTIWVVLYSTEEVVQIGRGENAGRTVTYRNVVLEMHRLTMWRGTAVNVELPLAEMMEANADGCVILIQEERGGLPGAIVGAAMYANPLAR